MLKRIPVSKGPKWAYVSFAPYLSNAVQLHIHKSRLNKSTITIKLSGDGVEVVRNITHGLFSFSILGESSPDLVYLFWYEVIPACATLIQSIFFQHN